MSGSETPRGPDTAAGSAHTAGVDQVDRAEAATSLVAWARGRIRLGRPGSGLATRVAALAFAVIAGGWPALDLGESIPTLAITCYIVTQAVAASVEFEIGPGFGIPTTAVMGAAILTVPPSFIPAAAFTGMALATMAAGLRDRERRDSPVALAISAWHSIGPAVVVGLLGTDGLSAFTLGVCALALAAQIALDFGAAWTRNCLDHGVDVRALIASFRFTGLIDLLLLPVGVIAALAAASAWFSPILVLPVLALLALLQRDRTRYLDHALALRDAFQRSAGEARTDSLTSLHNRLAWDERLEQLMARPGPAAVVLLDVDGLKRANDTFGHDTGDRLIVAVGNIVRDLRPEGATAARLGGDEFGLLISADSIDAISRLVRMATGNLRKAFDTAPPIDGRVPVQASIGSAVATSGSDLPATINQADQSVNHNKIERGARRETAVPTAPPQPVDCPAPSGPGSTCVQ